MRGSGSFGVASGTGTFRALGRVTVFWTLGFGGWANWTWRSRYTFGELPTLRILSS